MSPEPDDKLYLTDHDYDNHRLDTTFTVTPINRLFHLWNQVTGPRHTDKLDLLPTHLSKESRTTALREIKAIPEFFYTNTSLPIITPDNVQQFFKLVSNQGFSMTLFSICSGSGRLLLTMTGLPFSKCVLFPIDLRHGWDMNHKPHQQLIHLINRRYKPKHISIEPRCKHWSRAGNVRDPALTIQLRHDENPMLRFYTELLAETNSDGRDCLVENPVGSDIWLKSPLHALTALTTFDDNTKHTDQCAFSPEPDGQRHKKRTKLKATFQLNKCVRNCNCRKPHIILQGYDHDAHRDRTAGAALFSRKFCFAICTDINDNDNKKQTAQTKRLNKYNRRIDKPNDTFHADHTTIDNFPAEDDTPAPAAVLPIDNSIEARTQRYLDDLKRMDLIAVKVNFDSAPILQSVDKPMFVACIQDFFDKAYSLLRIGHFNICFMSKDHLATDDADIQGLRQILSKVMTISIVSAQMESRSPSHELLQLHNLAPDFLTQIAIYGNDDGIYTAKTTVNYKQDNNWQLPTDVTFMFIIYGHITLEVQQQLQQAPRRLHIKQQRPVQMIAPPPGLPPPGEVPVEPPADEEAAAPGVDDIKINKRSMKVMRPNVDLRDLPRQLVSANKAERSRLLRGFHERFWHAGPQDTLRLLQAAMLPRDICLEGVQISRDCEHCRKFALKIPKSQLKSHLATVFNEIVQHDLFFLWDKPFMLLIDEAIRWKTGDELVNKQSPALLKAILYLWIRMFGPMQHLLTDQEGGLLSESASRFFEKFNITRLLVGQGGSGTKGLVERHIGITKHSMLCLKDAAKKENLDHTDSDICIESCMSQNLLLEYGGGTPQAALTGHYQRGWYTPDSETISSITGSLESRPDFVESSFRLRLMAKQAILQSIIQDRLARAAHMKQHKHPAELLQPGMQVDIWRQPNRKDEDGWRGPAELISLERKAGSAIVRYQGLPLIIPLAQLRKHILLSYWIHQSRLTKDSDSGVSCFHTFVNPEVVREVGNILVEHDFFNMADAATHKLCSTIMDIIDGQPPGKLHIVGLVRDGDTAYKYVPDKDTVETHYLLQLCRQLCSKEFAQAHGIVYGNGLRRIHPVQQTTWGLLFRWHRDNRLDYTLRLMRITNPQVFHNDFDKYGMFLLYSFDHQEEEHPYPPIDWSDLSEIPYESDEEPFVPLLPAPPPLPVPPDPPDNDMDDHMHDPGPDSPDNNDDSMPDGNDDDPMLQPPSAPPAPPGPGPSPLRPLRAQGQHEQPAFRPTVPILMPARTPSPLGPSNLPPVTPWYFPGTNNSPSTGSNTTPITTPTSSNQQPNTQRTDRSHQQADSLSPTPPTPLPIPSPPSLPPILEEETTTTTHDHNLDKRPRANSGTSSTKQRPPKRNNSTSPTRPQPSSTSSSSTHIPIIQGTTRLPMTPTDTTTTTTSPPAIPPLDISTSTDNSRSTDEPDLYYLQQTLISKRKHDNVVADMNMFIHKQRAVHEFVTDHDPIYNSFLSMCKDLSHEMSYILEAQGIHNIEYYVDLVDGTVFRVDDETGMLTDDDMKKYAHLVEAADHAELEQFITFNVFRAKARSEMKKGENVVDCIWLRRWKVFGKIVKCRMCARGCFDKQKNFIEKHSSTATRLSQRMVLSAGMCDGMVYSYDKADPLDIDTESLDISSAFLQGLDYSKLQDQARSLGYEQRDKRVVYIKPPENVWRHFRAMASAPRSFQIADWQRAMWVLECLRAMYGFADAPLMFQLALLTFLLRDCKAYKSVFDDNYLYWLWEIDGNWQLVLIMTVHVDDLQITGSKVARNWIHKQLEGRFGKLKRQVMPYTHAGIQLERLSKNMIFLHQELFCSKLKPAILPKGFIDNPEQDLNAAETTIFRSLVCGALWACQTRLDEVCQVTSLQSAMKTPKVKDLMAANTMIKRISRSKGSERIGIYFRRLFPPFRLVTVSDASAANKTSNFATEGICVLMAEDRIDELYCDKQDFMDVSQVALMGGAFHLLAGSSQKAKRVSHSTSHAETHSAAKAIPLGQLVALRLGEPMLNSVRSSPITPSGLMQIIETGLLPVPHDHVIDCMDLWDLSCGQKGIPQDKSQRLGILAIREERRSLRLRRLYHVTTHYMLCDLLTKYSGYFSRSLQELVTCGIWTVSGKVRVREHFGKPSASAETSTGGILDI